MNDRFLANYKIAWIITSDKLERISPRTTRDIVQMKRMFTKLGFEKVIESVEGENSKDINFAFD